MKTSRPPLDKSQKRAGTIFLSAVGSMILLVIGLEIKSCADNNEIDEHKGITKGILYDITTSRNGSTAHWKYEVNEIEYTNSESTNTLKIHEYCAHKCIGDTFVVEYSTINPHKSRLVIPKEPKPEEVKTPGQPYP